MDNDFRKRIEFLIEIDKIKQIFRRTKLFDQSRVENDAEHSWHLAVMAITLADYANEEVDILRVIKMVLIHDVVEIDAGDYIVYTTEGEEKKEKEYKAAKRIFNILPKDLAEEFLTLWYEFEKNETADASFANSIDRLEPIMQNYYSKGEAWQKHSIKGNQIREANKKIAKGSKKLWAYTLSMIDETVDKGYIKNE
ncbi:MAG: HD domain-containing protein [Clostridia bacterium]